MIRKISILLWAGIIGLLSNPNALAVDYKEYKYSRAMDEYFAVSFDSREVTVSANTDDGEIISFFAVDDLKERDGEIIAGGKMVFGSKALFLDGREFPYDEIADSRITENDDLVTIQFYRRDTSETSVSRFKKGNLISASRSVRVEEDEFIRGLVLSVTGDVEIFGEVNKDVIAIWGDIFVAPEAVVRGDIACVLGRADASKEASVYGEMYDSNIRKARRKHRFSRDDHDWKYLSDALYNRVDGLGIYNGVKYADTDSLLPTVWVKVGYAFNSERWRYEVGVEQTLLRDPAALSIGGSLHRRLASDDDWLLGDRENSAFAVIAREDFKDYYEAEGGVIYAKTRAFDNYTFESGLRIEDTKWLDGRRHLWSLFGGSKLFAENFNTVEETFRTSSIAEIDTTTNAYWYNRFDWDTRLEGEPFERSAWHVSAGLEWSNEGLGSDFDYRRYTVAVRRYQKVNRRTMLVARGMYGGSDGYLPMYKRFFLGGLGTLRGYDHKEYMGSRFWLANTEYRVDFPRVEIGFSIFWDIGQIANDCRLDSSVDIKNNVGVALYLEDDFRVSLAKRLDRSYDDNPVFYVRLEHVF